LRGLTGADEDRPVQAPDVHYARSSDGTHIAYQVAGDGPMDVLMVSAAYSNIELIWTLPSFAPFLDALASLARVLCFDPRGSGLSDPLTVGRLPTLETRVADALTVMEAADSERPALFGMDSTGPLAMFFAATYPDRAAALVLFGTFASGLRDEDYPWAWSVEEWEAHDREVEERWGQPDYVESFVRWMDPSARLDRDDRGLGQLLPSGSQPRDGGGAQPTRAGDRRPTRPADGAGPDARAAPERRGGL
jgi:pimeloyl-ACP methyl ester carboxylesterase